MVGIKVVTSCTGEVPCFTVIQKDGKDAGVNDADISGCVDLATVPHSARSWLKILQNHWRQQSVSRSDEYLLVILELR